MISAEDIKQRIREALPEALVQVLDLTGGQDHYQVLVVASQFENRTPVDRHRLVYAPLKDVLGGELHAFSLETRTPAEWQEFKERQGRQGGSLPRLQGPVPADRES